MNVCSVRRLGIHVSVQDGDGVSKLATQKHGTSALKNTAEAGRPFSFLVLPQSRPESLEFHRRGS